MQKNLETYLKEYACHLRDYDKSKKTIEGFNIAVKFFLCDVISNKEAKNGYVMKYTPETINYNYLKDYTKRIKKELENANNQKIKLTGIKRYLKFIKAKYENPTYDEYIENKNKYSEKTDEDILKITTPEPTMKILPTNEEIKQLLDLAKTKENGLRNHAILKLFFYTSQRLHSIVNLNKTDVNPEPKYTKNGTEYYEVIFKYLKGKNKNPKVIPIPKDCMDAINDYAKVREDYVDGYIEDNYRKKLYHKDALFLNGEGQRYMEMSIYSMIRRYADELGIKKRIHPHLFRHLTISKLNVAGISDTEVKSISAHSKNSSAIETYKNAVKDDVVDKVFPVLDLNKDKQEKKQESAQQPTNQELMEMIKKLQKENEELKEEQRRNDMMYG